MEKLRIHVCGTDIHVTELDKLTTGMVGATASFSFSPEWNGLLKTAVFCSGIKKDVILTGDTVKIPPECIRTPGLTVGVYGHLADGTEVIPTVMSERIEVATGTKPSGDTQSGFTPDKWMQLLGMIGDLSMLTTDDKANLVAAINEAARKGGGAVDPAEIQRIVTEYLAANPPTVKETDPTVPAWAKQPQKPSYTAAEVGAQPKGNYVKTVNGVAPDQSGNVKVDIPEGGSGLTEAQINALDGLFKIAAYTENASGAYAAFQSAFGLSGGGEEEPDEPSEPDNPPEDVDIPSIKQGSVAFDTGGMNLNGTMTSRATLIPIGQYLEKGTTYRFSLGNAASTYVYGVQVFVADSHALEFPYASEIVYYEGVSERIVDSGWRSDDYTYTPDRDNCILAVNFRRSAYGDMNDSDHAVLFESFTIEETAQPDEPDVPDEPDEPDVTSVKQGTISFENGKMKLSGTTNYRATLIPIGQYLEKGTTYRFSLGNAASTYVYGVQVFVADSHALEFPHAYEDVYYEGVTERIVDSGWITNDYTYTPDRDNCILSVNFKKKDYAIMSDSDYAVLFENFVFVKVV